MASAPTASGVILFSPARGRALLTITGLSKLLPAGAINSASFGRHGVAHPITQFDAPDNPTLIDLS